MSMQITARIKVNGGSLLSSKNADRIIARSTKATDRYGNSLPTPIHRLRDEPPYFCTWRVKKERKGYIFLEVNNGSGISGHHPTVRALVISALHFQNIKVTVE